MKKENPTKVCICLPSGETFKTRTTLSLIALMKYMGDFKDEVNCEIAVSNHQCSILPWGRTSCVEDAIRMGADYIFWVDSDMWFPPETLHVLLSHKKDVVGCVYAMKTTEIKPVIPYWSQPYEGLSPVPLLATGLMLMKVDCFKEKLRKPWFEFRWEEYIGKEGEGRYIGEDVILSRRLRDEGYTLWCDFELSTKVGHCGDKVYFLDGFGRGEKLDGWKQKAPGIQGGPIEDSRRGVLQAGGGGYSGQCYPESECQGETGKPSS